MAIALDRTCAQVRRSRRSVGRVVLVGAGQARTVVVGFRRGPSPPFEPMNGATKPQGETVGKINRTQLIRRALGATAAAALMVVGLVGTAQAQTATTNAAATFAAQARAAGL